MAEAADGAFNLSAVAPGVFVHLGKPLALDAPGHDDIANIGFIVGTRCVAVIDSGGSVRIGRALRAAIRRRTSLPICYVINTHVHVDHVLGNAAFKDDHPSFVGHAALAAALARSRDFFLRQYAGDFDAPATAAQIIGPDRDSENHARPGSGRAASDSARMAESAYRLRPDRVRRKDRHAVDRRPAVSRTPARARRQRQGLARGNRRSWRTCR